MRYVKVKVSFCYAPDRLYRVLLVPEKVDLLHFAKIIGDSLHFEWEHSFEFRKGNTDYVLDAEDDFGSIFSNRASEAMQEHDIRSLGQKAVFEYDFGDSWAFDVRIYKRTVERNEEKAAWILEGAGQGIWEDNIWSLYAYLDGSIGDDFEETEDSEYDLPWNFQNQHFSDFDHPLDLAAEQEFLDERLTHELILEDGEDDYDEDDEEAALERLLEVTEDMDRLGMDKPLRKWTDQTMGRLRSQYGEPLAAILVTRMLIDEQKRIMEAAEEEVPF